MFRNIAALVVLLALVSTGCSRKNEPDSESNAAVKSDEVLSVDGMKPFQMTVHVERAGTLVIPIISPDLYDIPVDLNAPEKEVECLYDLDCDGDGVYEKVSQTGNISCTYTSSGDFQFSVRGVLPGIKIRPADEGMQRFRIVSLDQWGDNAWRNLSEMFGCPNEGISEDEDNVSEVMCDTVGKRPVYQASDVPNLKKIRSLRCAGGYSEFKTSIAAWDVSQISDMSRMFMGCRSFNQSLENWNTSNVTDMSWMFSHAETFNQPLSKWNTSKVTSMEGMFESARSFDQPLDGWDTSNVTNMSWMFSNAQTFNRSLESWNTSKVSEFIDMFWHANAFNQPLENWDISHASNFSEMFCGAKTFNQPLGKWKIREGADTSSMFDGAEAFDTSNAPESLKN